jgi:MurNAc alpha-1-phosphate uridylyltransferase
MRVRPTPDIAEGAIDMTRCTVHERPTVAFVLAAGLGTRMRPLTDEIPKPMVPLAGRPLIDHVLDRLSKAGVMRAVVNVHYKPGPLLAHLASREHPAIVISDETELLLDTGGGVRRALGLIGSAPFLIHNSDTVWLEPPGASNISRLVDAWDPLRMDGLLLLARRDASMGYDGAGDFELATDGRLARRGMAESAPYVFAGVSVAHPRLFEGAPEGPFSLNRPWDAAIAHGRLHGLVMDGLWMHVGTPEALVEAEAEIARRPEWSIT